MRYLIGQRLCGSVGRVVASDTGGLRFESILRQNLFILNICLLSTVYRKDENKEKEAGSGQFWDIYFESEKAFDFVLINIKKKQRSYVFEMTQLFNIWGRRLLQLRDFDRSQPDLKGVPVRGQGHQVGWDRRSTNFEAEVKAGAGFVRKFATALDREHTRRQNETRWTFKFYTSMWPDWVIWRHFDDF